MKTMKFGVTLYLAGLLLVTGAAAQEKIKGVEKRRGEAPAAAQDKPATDKPAAQTGDKEHTVPPRRPDPDQRLALFRKLVGEWKGKSPDGNEIRVQYSVNGGGSTVVERMMPDTDHEMITVVHYDNEDLVLTHYCALGNQPRMKAKPAAPGEKSATVADVTAAGQSIAFVCFGGTNMKSENDPHMHAVTYTFLDDDHLRAEWVYAENGKPSGEPHAFEYERVKGGAAAKPAAGK